MFFDFLDDVFLLHLALETAQGVFQGLTLLDNYFSHSKIHPQSGSDWFLTASQHMWTPSLSSSIACNRCRSRAPEQRDQRNVKGAWHLLFNNVPASQVFFHVG